MLIIKSIAIRFSDKLHKAMKLKTVEENKTIQDYVITLIRKDLDIKEEDDDLSDYQKK